MHARCQLAINTARQSRGQNPLTRSQVDEIDARMSATMRRLAVKDVNAWQAMSADQRVIAAAKVAMQDIEAEAARKVANAQRQVLKTAETEQRIVSARARQPKWSRARTLVEDFQRTHAYIDGIKRDAVRGLFDLIDAADSMQGAGLGRRVLMQLFDAQNPQMSRDMALEVFSQGKASTGNALAKKGAEAWLQATENLRVRFNEAGGDVNKLDYGYLPQAHDEMRVARAGVDKWANDLLPMLDRKRYVREDGTRMTDAEVLGVLRPMWETVSTGGANKTQPGQFKGTGARANHGSESRQIHFRDGEAYLAYMGRYGTGSMYDAMIGHLGGMARDIGLVERYGPNPEAQMRVQFDLAERADGKRTGVLGQIAENMAGPEAQWRVLSGAAGSARYANLAALGQNIRNVEVFGKLQNATLSSLTDLNTHFVTVGYNRLPYMQALADIGRAMTPQTKEFLNMQGVIADSAISDLNRFAGEHIRNNWSGRISAATMRLSLMNAWTDTLRRAFSLTMMRGTAKLAKVDWPNLSEWDRYRMEAKGLTEADWQVLRQAVPEQHRGADFITPEGIYATGHPDAPAVVAKYIGMIADESEIAIQNPDLTTRAIATAGGAQAGTAGGEFARAVAQFKSFPIAMISRHWRRMLDTPHGLEGTPAMLGGRFGGAGVGPVTVDRLAYSAAMMVGLTALGAIAFQTKQLVSGKDPVDMTTGKFWGKALAQGGGLGFVGDMLLTDTSDDRSPLDTFGKMLLGPTFGSAADLYELTKGNIDEALAGKQTHLGAESVRFIRGHAPLVNLWYAKAALDHAGLYALQENLSPGYLSRIQSKAKKDWGQDYWWGPREDMPGRGPSFEDMLGQ